MWPRVSAVQPRNCVSVEQSESRLGKGARANERKAAPADRQLDTVQRNKTIMAEAVPITDTPEIREQLERILTSNSFRRLRKLQALFEYLVAETIEGRASQLTQKKIAAAVFHLTDAFDPQTEVTVRVSAGRLRTSLQKYYRTEARPGEPRIHLPQGHYYVAFDQSSRISPPEIPPLAPAKRISQSDMVGELGINLVQRLCLEMGFLWHSTGLEAGIDGYIEIRSETGNVTNCIVQVQCKATDRPFEGETPATLDFRCSARDLNYWLTGNAPVILVRCRPRTNEAYWVPLKNYFGDLGRRKSGKITFDKVRDRFDITAKSALQKLAIPVDSGLYLGTHPKPETVYSNLLQLASLPKHYYVAATEYRTPGEVFATLHEFTRNVHGEWILGAKMLTSFHDLSTQPWTAVCDRGSVEELDTIEWAQSADPIRQRQFVQLLNACLRDKLYRKGVKFSRESQCYYFRATQDLSEREYSYQSREHKTSRSVFKGYPKKSDHTQMSYYRHSAFEGRFVRYGNDWYLQVTPNYHFTRDGDRLSRFAPDLLSGIKRLETNQAVHGQVVMWAHLLTERDLFDTGSRFLDFASLLEFPLDAGLDDDAWLKDEDFENRAALQAPAVDDRQVSFLI